MRARTRPLDQGGGGGRGRGGEDNLASFVLVVTSVLLL